MTEHSSDDSDLDNVEKLRATPPSIRVKKGGRVRRFVSDRGKGEWFLAVAGIIVSFAALYGIGASFLVHMANSASREHIKRIEQEAIALINKLVSDASISINSTVDSEAAKVQEKIESVNQSMAKAKDDIDKAVSATKDDIASKAGQFGGIESLGHRITSVGDEIYSLKNQLNKLEDFGTWLAAYHEALWASFGEGDLGAAPYRRVAFSVLPSEVEPEKTSVSNVNPNGMLSPVRTDSVHQQSIRLTRFNETAWIPFACDRPTAFTLASANDAAGLAVMAMYDGNWEDACAMWRRKVWTNNFDSRHLVLYAYSQWRMGLRMPDKYRAFAALSEAVNSLDGLPVGDQSFNVRFLRAVMLCDQAALAHNTANDMWSEKVLSVLRSLRHDPDAPECLFGLLGDILSSHTFFAAADDEVKLKLLNLAIAAYREDTGRGKMSDHNFQNRLGLAYFDKGRILREMRQYTHLFSPEEHRRLTLEAYKSAYVAHQPDEQGIQVDTDLVMQSLTLLYLASLDDKPVERYKEADAILQKALDITDITLSVWDLWLINTRKIYETLESKEQKFNHLRRIDALFERFEYKFKKKKGFYGDWAAIDMQRAVLVGSNDESRLLLERAITKFEKDLEQRHNIFNAHIRLAGAHKLLGEIEDDIYAARRYFSAALLHLERAKEIDPGSVRILLREPVYRASHAYLCLSPEETRKQIHWSRDFLDRLTTRNLPVSDKISATINAGWAWAISSDSESETCEKMGAYIESIYRFDEARFISSREMDKSSMAQALHYLATSLAKLALELNPGKRQDTLLSLANDRDFDALRLNESNEVILKDSAILMLYRAILSSDQSEREKMLEQGVDLLNKALEFNPEYYDAKVGLAYTLITSARMAPPEDRIPVLDAALAICEQATEKRPKRAYAWTQFGNAYLAKASLLHGDERAAMLAKARNCLDKSIILKRFNNRAFLYQACAFALEENEEACREFLITARDKFLSLRGNFVDFYSELHPYRNKEWYRELINPEAASPRDFAAYDELIESWFVRNIDPLDPHNIAKSHSWRFSPLDVSSITSFVGDGTISFIEGYDPLQNTLPRSERQYLFEELDFSLDPVPFL